MDTNSRGIDADFILQATAGVKICNDDFVDYLNDISAGLSQHFRMDNVL